MNNACRCVAAGLLLVPGNALAQESASYKVTDYTFNVGVYPDQGAVPASASFKISLDSLGDGIVATGLAGASYQVGAGHIGAYAPAGEVSGLAFDDGQTLSWSSDNSAGSYNLYRDLLSSLSGLGFGQCEQQGLPSSTTTDTDTPATGDAFFYLVTAVNRIDEEGTKGTQSDGTGRAGTVCP
jgi:hypothetical protein